ncbi:hypothetical protein COV24_04270 [candidate division WWE3 bacterium CG10_big_fil_rev_8_21_14_0_10_32_10]|uniref:SUF system FeS cluster assembly SufBD core domain-containing protein n=1 Tax=candidate division WWE3 bacterium CG10_big_fil_rev_8_21_14_0_10_32_10 TaxID=1975090 RepID=A0A2H0R9E8_UNCKA|nr:MAG: hypothetical protein COV24_04270 [candidate division WWE3 bacterium CG10_big_fil_rev_8_21_14_0_10_32_10]
MKKIIKIYKLIDLPLNLKAEYGLHKIYYFYHTGSITKDIEIIVDNENSKIELKGAVFGKNHDQIVINTVTKHLVGINKARVTIKTVLTDFCTFDFTGMIEIEKKAQKCDSFLQQDNLVVSDNVICNTSPQLEIKADDVKASHGATVGNFDQNQLFYLQSRGLSLDDSQKLISEGFLASVFDKSFPKVMKTFNLSSLIS